MILLCISRASPSGPSAAQRDGRSAVGTEASSPDTTVTLYDTGGEGPDTDELDIERQTIQVRVRWKGKRRV